MGAAADSLRVYEPSDRAAEIASGKIQDKTEARSVILYSHYASICSQRARLVLVEKQVPFKGVMLHYDKLETISPTYLGINPRGLVPTVIADGDVVFDSATIMRYINNRYVGPELVPGNADQKAMIQSDIDRADFFPIRDMVAYVGQAAAKHGATYSGWGAETVKKYLEAIRVMKDEYPEFAENYALKLEDWQDQFSRVANPETMDATKALVEQTMDEFDHRLSTQAYLVGDSYSLSDLTWTPILIRLHYALGYKIWSDSKRSNLKAYFETKIRTRASFKSAITRHYYNDAVPEGLA